MASKIEVIKKWQQIQWLKNLLNWCFEKTNIFKKIQLVIEVNNCLWKWGFGTFWQQNTIQNTTICFEYAYFRTNIYVQPVCCKIQQNKVTGLQNRGPLKDLNDYKLIVYESKWSSRINFIPFRIFRGPLFREFLIAHFFKLSKSWNNLNSFHLHIGKNK